MTDILSPTFHTAWWVCEIVPNVTCNIWDLRRFIKSSSILHQPLKSTLSPTLYLVIEVMTDSWANSARENASERQTDWEEMVPLTLSGEFAYGYEAGHSGCKTLCHKTQVSWFDIWQLHNILAAFSSPNVPAVQLKMEMIYIPQRLNWLTSNVGRSSWAPLWLWHL